MQNYLHAATARGGHVTQRQSCWPDQPRAKKPEFLREVQRWRRSMVTWLWFCAQEFSCSPLFKVTASNAVLLGSLCLATDGRWLGASGLLCGPSAVSRPKGWVGRRRWALILWPQEKTTPWASPRRFPASGALKTMHFVVSETEIQPLGSVPDGLGWS